jgi:ribosomal protein S18 acetylase RimI-like enzyme
MAGFNYRKATTGDIPFLVDTIIEAEKSGTDKLSYTTVFGLSEADTRKYLANMLDEEVDGCELSVSSFLLAEWEGEIAAAVASWIENEHGMPSSVLKGNLLSYTLPAESISKARELSVLLSELHIENTPDTLQLGLVYVSNSFRGKNLVSELINRQIEWAKSVKPAIKEMFVQVFGNNTPAIKAYEKAGFETALEKIAQSATILNYLPSVKKLLMKKNLVNL